MYEYRSRIRFSETDLTGRLSMQGLLRLFQDVSYLQAEDAGRGIAYQNEHGAAWYLLSWDVHMCNPPGLSEPVAVSCFFYAQSGSLAKKYMVLTDARGERLAYANTRWAFVDTRTGCPKDCPADYWGCEGLAELPPDIPRIRRIPVPKNGQLLTPLTADRALLDENGHVNNVRFSELALSLVGLDVGASCLRAEFLRQTFPGTCLYPRLCRTGEGAAVIAFCDTVGVPYAVFECA